MRRKREPQLHMSHIIPRTEIGRELQAMSVILDENPNILDLVHKDLVGLRSTETGRTGMTGEQTLRAAVLKQYRELTYEELSFHLADSSAFRAFARLGRGQYPSTSALQDNIKAISWETWEKIIRTFVRYAAEKGMEKGRTIRVDSTATETNIHYPQDSRLLEDCIRVLTRLLSEGRRLKPVPGYSFSDHQRVVKKRLHTIRDTRKEEVRRKCYKDLLGIAAQVRGYALNAIEVLRAYESPDEVERIRARILAEEMERLLGFMDKVMTQTRRRVMEGEKVPAGEKVFSVFECHTDIVEKGKRETVYCQQEAKIYPLWELNFYPLRFVEWFSDKGGCVQAAGGDGADRRRSVETESREAKTQCRPGIDPCGIPVFMPRRSRQTAPAQAPTESEAPRESKRAAQSHTG